jgi:hypothetical protein
MSFAAALKEWAIAVNALTQGETIVLLRKGGLREQSGKFTIPSKQVWLFPTYEHQQPHLLKAPYGDRVRPVPSGWHPERIEIPAWAEIGEVLQVQDPQVVARLFPFHIWSESFVAERLAWKPQTPLFVLLLRVYRLKHPHEIAYRESYGGCRSWIKLEQALTSEGAIAVLSDEVYAQQVNLIRERLQNPLTES